MGRSFYYRVKITLSRGGQWAIRGLVFRVLGVIGHNIIIPIIPKNGQANLF
jgi:hypothetical protein